jgi:hypothetical protein
VIKIKKGLEKEIKYIGEIVRTSFSSVRNNLNGFQGGFSY